MALIVEIHQSGRAHFTRTNCKACGKNVMVTYTIPFLCSRCGHVMNTNLVFLHRRVKYRYKFHSEGDMHA